MIILLLKYIDGRRCSEQSRRMSHYCIYQLQYDRESTECRAIPASTIVTHVSSSAMSVSSVWVPSSTSSVNVSATCTNRVSSVWRVSLLHLFSPLYIFCLLCPMFLQAWAVWQLVKDTSATGSFRVLHVLEADVEAGRTCKVPYMPDDVTASLFHFPC